MGNTILGIPVHLHRKSNLHRLRDELAAAESERDETRRNLHRLRNELAAAESERDEARQVMRDLLEEIGYAASCTKCTNAISILLGPAGPVLLNPDGTQHIPCRRTPRPAATPATNGKEHSHV